MHLTLSAVVTAIHQFIFCLYFTYFLMFYNSVHVTILYPHVTVLRNKITDVTSSMIFSVMSYLYFVLFFFPTVFLYVSSHSSNTY